MVRQTIAAQPEARPDGRVTASGYQSGFANHFVSEAVPGAVPVGRNSPQMPPTPHEAREAVIRFGGNKSLAARHLQISRKTLYQKLHS